MTNYVKATDFATKDGLASGNAAKVVLGTELDDEFNLLATASATKEDTVNKGANNGYAGLDAGGLVAVSDLPTATDAVAGIVEKATQLELEALVADRALQPSNFDLSAMTADNAPVTSADRLVFYSNSAGELRQTIMDNVINPGASVQTAFKSSSELRSAAHAVDTDFDIALVADTHYIIEAYIPYEPSALTADMVIGVQYDQGEQLGNAMWESYTEIGVHGDDYVELTVGATEITQIETLFIGSTPNKAVLRGVVQSNAGTGGTLSIRWGVTGTGNITVRQGAWFRITRLD